MANKRTASAKPVKTSAAHDTAATGTAPDKAEQVDASSQGDQPQVNKFTKKDEVAARIGLGSNSKKAKKDDRAEAKREAERAAARKKNRNIASRGVTGKKQEEPTLSKAAREKAAALRKKRILVGIVCALLVIAFCVPSAIYLISGANPGTSTEETTDKEAQYEEQVASYQSEIASDPSATTAYKKLGALYTEWADDIAEGTITDSAHTSDELYGEAITAYNTYLAQDSAPSSSTYKNIASVYTDWASRISSGAITGSTHTSDELYENAIASYSTYHEVSGKASAYKNIAETSVTWATAVANGTIADSTHTSDELYENAIAAYNTYAALDGDADVSTDIAQVYYSWANGIKQGTITTSSASESELWTRCIDAYGSYLGAHADAQGTDDYSAVVVAQAQARNYSGDFDGAAAQLKALTESSPSYLSAWVSLAYLYEDTGDTATAQEYYRAMTTANEGNPYAWYYLGYFLSNQGDTEGAQDAYQSGLDADPDDTYGLASTLKMMMGTLDSGSASATETSEKTGLFSKLKEKLGLSKSSSEGGE